MNMHKKELEKITFTWSKSLLNRDGPVLVALLITSPTSYKKLRSGAKFC
jgi:hypothetical protein